MKITQAKQLFYPEKMADVTLQNIETDLDEVWGSEVNLCFPLNCMLVQLI